MYNETVVTHYPTSNQLGLPSLKTIPSKALYLPSWNTLLTTVVFHADTNNTENNDNDNAATVSECNSTAEDFKLC